MIDEMLWALAALALSLAAILISVASEEECFTDTCVGCIEDCN